MGHAATRERHEFRTPGRAIGPQGITDLLLDVFGPGEVYKGSSHAPLVRPTKTDEHHERIALLGYVMEFGSWAALQKNYPNTAERIQHYGYDAPYRDSMTDQQRRVFVHAQRIRLA